ncbi:MBL fold metallo-hydrolase [Mucilaginibacter rubeus]|uniref:MBL fold metallo-hydrolase n=1 Tax=Mucilaginibacter rubeus TaxID=2027860 RepID=A0AAE6JAU7_9SPHI|nr:MULTISPECIES: rhodanese-like domain-containing protein [Mucilaginibacter]QEM02289.1 MBL fold metallo-hydrolase [Mucilaginibacter rubeus]QEM14915.1 MBL fold metallo-hydrolase [Mucilaginibacter gossypii]QTE42369.1 MBL fold metallo-hydrolase [Mucilaginibacter rubeus]QTE48970.1 MBL fold metallo-hydrolase [Mucilaginibacter rubeus]QTE54068.1 MBL fold metallo-hydrolase [Mucilaginibacter rubeus]
MNTQEITATELQKMFENGKEMVVLDIRPQEQREEWQIAGSIHNNVYDRLIAGDKTVFDNTKFDRETPIVTVCAGGKTSLIAADILNTKGYNVLSLQGGMKAWNYAWNTAEIKHTEVTIVQVRRVAKGCISYIIGSDKEAIVVDASLEPSVYMELAQKNGWTIKYVMDTHVHADYISRTIELAKATGATHLFTENAGVSYAFVPLNDREIVPFGSANLTAIFTPGHTPESISYLINNDYLLTGDTLFTNGVGRPDLKADYEQGLQKAEQLFISLGKILVLSDNDLLILPAHTSSSIAFDGKIIGDKLSNLSAKIELLQLEKEAFIAQTMKRIPPTPPNYIQIATLNKSGNYEGINPADLEAGANRCAVS